MMHSIYPQQSLQYPASEVGLQSEPQAPAPPPNTSDTTEFPALPGNDVIAPQIKRQQFQQVKQQQPQLQQQAQQQIQQQFQQQQQQQQMQQQATAPMIPAQVINDVSSQQQKMKINDGKKIQLDFAQNDPSDVMIQQQQQQQQQQQEQYVMPLQQQQLQLQMKEFGLSGYIAAAKQKIPDEVPKESIFAVQKIHEQPFTPKQSYTIELKKKRSDYINSLSESTLFYAFFAMPGDKMQYLAAQKLYSMDWKFHTGYSTWIRPVNVINKDTHLVGTWDVFSCENWNIITAELVVFRKDLAPLVIEDKSD